MSTFDNQSMSIGCVGKSGHLFGFLRHYLLTIWMRPWANLAHSWSLGRVLEGERAFWSNFQILNAQLVKRSFLKQRFNSLMQEEFGNPTNSAHKRVSLWMILYTLYILWNIVKKKSGSSILNLLQLTWVLLSLFESTKQTLICWSFLAMNMSLLEHLDHIWSY